MGVATVAEPVEVVESPAAGESDIAAMEVVDDTSAGLKAVDDTSSVAPNSPSTLHLAAKLHAELLETKKRQLEEMMAKRRAMLDGNTIPGSDSMATAATSSTPT